MACDDIRTRNSARASGLATVARDLRDAPLPARSARPIAAAILLAPALCSMAAGNAPARPQPSAPVATTTRVDLGGAWRVRVGDAAEWSSPLLDDSAWRTTSLPATWPEQGLAGVDGPVWYRRVIDLEGGLTRSAPDGWGLLLGRTRFGALALWVNGIAVGSIGGPSLRVPVPALRVMPVPPAAIAGRDRLAVAIRVDRVAWASDRAEDGGPVGQQLVLGPLRDLAAEAALDRHQELFAALPLLIASIVYLGVALGFTLLWIRWRFAVEHLWFGAVALGFAANIFVNSPWAFEVTERFLLVVRLREITGLLIAATFIEFLWSYLKRPLPMPFRTYQASFGVLAIAIAASPTLGWVIDTEALRWIWLLPLLGYGLYAVVAEARRGSRDARGVAIAGVLLVATELLAIAAGLLHWLPPLALEPAWAFGVFVVAMAVVLFDRLDRMRLELRDRVASLSLARATLRENEERLNLALQSTGLGLWDQRFDTGKLTISERWAAMLGYSAAELNAEAEPWRTRVHPEDLPATMATLDRHLRGETPLYESEHRLRTKSGDWIWVSDRGRVVERETDGRPRRFIGTLLDITERKRAEEALQASDRRFRDFVENVLLGVYRTTEQGRVLLANPAMARILGFPSLDALLNADLEEWAVRHAYPRPGLKEKLAREGGLTGYESKFTRDDGTVVHLRETARVVRDRSGAVQYYEGIIEDMTEHRRLEEQLRQSQKMEVVGTLAGGVAHDFNNLLQAMLSHVQLLQQQVTDSARVAEMGRELEHHIDRGASLTRQLLVFSRRGTTKPERLDLNEAIRDATNLLRRLVRANIALSTDLGNERLLVEVDRGQLQQVLMNLTLNASDAMPGGGTLIIRTGSLGHHEVSLSVEDTGHGIPEENRKRIFEPFFTTKEPGRGTGLGLSVVQGIVVSHGGRIEVTSEVGRGSIFRVFLPRATPIAQTEAHETPPLACEPASGNGERILLVEDEDGARDGLRDILTSTNYDVVAVGSGEDAQRLAEDQPFDVLLTDLMLPGVSGPQIAVELQERWPTLRVIMMSGYARDEAVRLGVSAGAVRFLQKPFDMATLLREVRAALAERPEPARRSP